MVEEIGRDRERRGGRGVCVRERGPDREGGARWSMCVRERDVEKERERVYTHLHCP